MIKISKNTSWFKNLVDNGLTEEQIKVIGKRWREISRETGIDEISDIFEIDIASLISGKSYKYSLKNIIVNGSSDGHIDAIYEANNTWYFIQIKMKPYDHSYIRKMSETFNSYFSNIKSVENEDNKSLKDFKGQYIEKANRNTKHVFVYVGLSDNKTESARQAFKTIPHEVQVYSYSELFRYMINEDVKREEKEFVIHIPKMGNTTNKKTLKFDGVLGVVEAEELISQFIDLNDIEVDNIFNMNIRNKVVNKKFKTLFEETIKESPDYFHLFNNGITMIADRMDDSHNFGKVIVVNPQIINGQQTFRTLLEIYREKENLNGILVPIKIINETDKDVINSIARFSNNQTAVKEAELKYSTPKYTDIVNMAKKYGYKLNGKRGKRDSDELLATLSEGGEISINEIIRSHASIFYHSDYIGKSKSSISTVVNIWFKDDDKMSSLLKSSNFKSCLKVIDQYEKMYNSKLAEVKKSLLGRTYSRPVYYQTLRKKMNPYKYGISIFYYLAHTLPNIDLDKALNYIFEEHAKGNMNWYKKNSDASLSIKYIKDNRKKFI